MVLPWSRKGVTTSRVCALATTGTISKLTPEPRQPSTHCCNKGRSSHSISWKQRSKFGSTRRCQVDERRVLMTSGRRRFLCDISNCGDLMPGAEGGVAYGTVLVGGEAMAAELEVVVDAGVGGQELLGVAR